MSLESLGALRQLNQVRDSAANVQNDNLEKVQGAVQQTGTTEANRVDNVNLEALKAQYEVALQKAVIDRIQAQLDREQKAVTVSAFIAVGATGFAVGSSATDFARDLGGRQSLGDTKGQSINFGDGKGAHSVTTRQGTSATEHLFQKEADTKYKTVDDKEDKSKNVYLAQKNSDGSIGSVKAGNVRDSQITGDKGFTGLVSADGKSINADKAKELKLYDGSGNLDIARAKEFGVLNKDGTGLDIAKIKDKEGGALGGKGGLLEGGTVNEAKAKKLGLLNDDGTATDKAKQLGIAKADGSGLDIDAIKAKVSDGGGLVGANDAIDTEKALKLGLITAKVDGTGSPILDQNHNPVYEVTQKARDLGIVGSDNQLNAGAIKTHLTGFSGLNEIDSSAAQSLLHDIRKSETKDFVRITNDLSDFGYDKGFSLGKTLTPDRLLGVGNGGTRSVGNRAEDLFKAEGKLTSGWDDVKKAGKSGVNALVSIADTVVPFYQALLAAKEKAANTAIELQAAKEKYAAAQKKLSELEYLIKNPGTGNIGSGN